MTLLTNPKLITSVFNMAWDLQEDWEGYTADVPGHVKLLLNVKNITLVPAEIPTGLSVYCTTPLVLSRFLVECLTQNICDSDSADVFVYIGVYTLRRIGSFHFRHDNWQFSVKNQSDGMIDIQCNNYTLKTEFWFKVFLLLDISTWCNATFFWV